MIIICNYEIKFSTHTYRDLLKIVLCLQCVTIKNVESGLGHVVKSF